MTDRYAAFGNPMGHARSPWIHREFARQTGEDIAYDAIEAPVAGFAAAVDAFREAGGCGANVTVPFKVEACGYATSLSARARLAGAVNCLRFAGDRVEAENFDGVGLVADVQANLGYTLAGRRVLVLGAGGAARGLVQPLLDAGAATIMLAARSAAPAQAIALRHGDGRVRATALPDLQGTGAFDLVLNATTASVRREGVAVPVSVFAAGTLAYDLFYALPVTPFLAVAGTVEGVRTATGAGMLVEQAAASYAWWRGTRPRTADIIAALRREVGATAGA